MIDIRQTIIDGYMEKAILEHMSQNPYGPYSANALLVEYSLKDIRGSQDIRKRLNEVFERMTLHGLLVWYANQFWIKGHVKQKRHGAKK